MDRNRISLLKENDLLESPGYGISQHDPSITSPEKCRYDACVGFQKLTLHLEMPNPLPFLVANMQQCILKRNLQTLARLGQLFCETGYRRAAFSSTQGLVLSITRWGQAMIQKQELSTVKFACQFRHSTSRLTRRCSRTAKRLRLLAAAERERYAAKVPNTSSE